MADFLIGLGIGGIGLGLLAAVLLALAFVAWSSSGSH